jgi:hypothetical protein
MPFTFSHPAVVIPIAKKRLILSAAIIGSMAPDFEYFLKLSSNSHFGHTFPGIFLFSLPVGLFILWLFHSFIKKPAIDLMPVNFQARLTNCCGKFNFFPFSRFTFIIISLLFGIISHIAWDSLTHLDGFFVKHIAFFNIHYKIMNTYIPVYFLLQHISTGIGILVIARLTLKWYKSTPVQKIVSLHIQSDRNRAVIVLAIIIASFSSGICFSSIPLSLHNNFYYFSKITGLIAVYTISFAFIWFLIYSTFWHLTISATKVTKNTKR